MEYVDGTPLPHAVARGVMAPAAARRGVAAAGDALRRLHRHAAVSGAEVALSALVDEIRTVADTVLRPVGVRLPAELEGPLGAVPGTRAHCRRVLLHGDYVPSNLIVTGPGTVGMIDPVLAQVGLPEDDLARFLAILSSETVFVPGLSAGPLRRLRRDMEDTFRTAYGPAAAGTVMELRLIKQHVLRWRRRRDHTRLAEGSSLMRARRRVIDGHMRMLLIEAGQRLTRSLDAPGRR
jgi:aminoglycoside phosphotransferase (APT) family kinase protein